MNICDRYVEAKKAAKAAELRASTPPSFDVDALANYVATGNLAPISKSWDGEKFAGGFGATYDLEVDYYTMRMRSSQLFRQNLPAKGLIRRFVTNIIGTGLNAVCDIEHTIVDMDDDDVSAWSDVVESHFSIYATRKELTDYKCEHNLFELQEILEREALIDGDVLVICRIDKNTKLPNLQYVRGEYVSTPLNVPKNRKVIDGVHVDSVTGKQLGYYVENTNSTDLKNTHVYVKAYGDNSGRRVAWLHYGSERRNGDVRGEPLLGLILQSLKELDRYRDATLRKAVVNSIYAMFVQRDVDSKTIASKSLTKTTTHAQKPVEPTDTANLNLTKFGEAGIVVDGLAPGETVQAHNPQGLGESYQQFEGAMINAIAWAYETPPEILKLSFNSNYSASQAARLEHNMFLQKERSKFSNQSLQPLYEEFVYSLLLVQTLENKELLDSWNKPDQWITKGAWLKVKWVGYVKPSVDPVKTVTAYGMMRDRNWITDEQVVSELSGGKYGRIVLRNAKANKQLKDLDLPIIINKQPFEELDETEAEEQNGSE